MIVSLDNLSQSLETGRPLLGLDTGTKTIGAAISDRLCIIATPYLLIRRTKFTLDVKVLLEHAEKKNVAGFIVGLPKNMNGREGPACQAARAFARNLNQYTDLPITFWDERCSTLIAERALIEANISRAKRRNLVDKAAAAYILQGALDYIRTKHHREPPTPG